MSHTNATTNYSLSQFISTDTPAWMTDVNGDNQKIDTALHNNATAASTNATDIAAINTTLGNYLPSVGTTGNVLKKTNTGAAWSQAAASEVTYDNTDSGLSATDVKEALDELAAGLIIFRDFTTSDDSFAGGTVGTRAGACEVSVDSIAGYVPVSATIINIKSSVSASVGTPILDPVNMTCKSVITRNSTGAFSEWVEFRVVYLKTI